KIGRSFRGIPQVTNVMEGGGKTPWVPPAQLAEMGFSMVLYPTSIIFRVVNTIESALQDLKSGRPMNKSQSVELQQFEKLLGMPYWQDIENRHQHTQEEHLGIVEWLKHSSKRLLGRAS